MNFSSSFPLAGQRINVTLHDFTGTAPPKPQHPSAAPQQRHPSNNAVAAGQTCPVVALFEEEGWAGRRLTTCRERPGKRTAYVSHGSQLRLTLPWSGSADSSSANFLFHYQGRSIEIVFHFKSMLLFLLLLFGFFRRADLATGTTSDFIVSYIVYYIYQ